MLGQAAALVQIIFISTPRKYVCLLCLLLLHSPAGFQPVCAGGADVTRLRKYTCRLIYAHHMLINITT